MKKKLLALIMACCFFMANTIASTAYNDDNAIPSRQTPGAVIEYQEDNTWETIVEGCGEPLNTETTSGEETADTSSGIISLDEEERIIRAIEMEADLLPHYISAYPAPTPGMRVIYDNWGEIETVLAPNADGALVVVEPYFLNTDSDTDVSTPLLRLSQGTRKPAGTYTYGSVVSNSVGYTTNTIKITTGSVLGTGDFTCFTDTIGDHDNYLQYGDCATKNSIDNPWYGTVIYARNMTNNVGTSFIKNDNGGLPNAVLDIWKTGLTKLGVTSTNYNYIKFAGRYYYTF